MQLFIRFGKVRRIKAAGAMPPEAHVQKEAGLKQLLGVTRTEIQQEVAPINHS